MNHRRAVKNFALHTGFSIAYTAANSSFQNPIEFLFAKIKAPLKSIYGASE